MQSKYEIRFKTGDSIYYSSLLEFLKAMITNTGKIYYFRVNFN